MIRPLHKSRTVGASVDRDGKFSVLKSVVSVKVFHVLIALIQKDLCTVLFCIIFACKAKDELIRS
jgi:hypothetical protein